MLYILQTHLLLENRNRYVNLANGIGYEFEFSKGDWLLRRKTIAISLSYWRNRTIRCMYVLRHVI